MAIRTEITLRLQNSPGALAGVFQVFSDERVNVLAGTVESTGTFRAVVDNPVHALGILRERHYQPQERDVLYVLMPNSPGALARVSRLLVDGGVNVDYLYGSAVEGDSMCAVVVGVEDAQRAASAAGM